MKELITKKLNNKYKYVIALVFYIKEVVIMLINKIFRR